MISSVKLFTSMKKLSFRSQIGSSPMKNLQRKMTLFPCKANERAKMIQQNTYYGKIFAYQNFSLQIGHRNILIRCAQQNVASLCIGIYRQSVHNIEFSMELII